MWCYKGRDELVMVVYVVLKGERCIAGGLCDVIRRDVFAAGLCGVIRGDMYWCWWFMCCLKGRHVLVLVYVVL